MHLSVTGKIVFAAQKLVANERLKYIRLIRPLNQSVHPTFRLANSFLLFYTLPSAD